MPKFIDLSHVIQDGMITYQGPPGPKICDHLSREDSKQHYAGGTTFQIGKIEMEKEHIYEQTYTDYLSRIAELDLPFLADKLGIQLDGQHVIIPFFDKPYRISAKGISDPLNRQPHLSVSVILCKYLLMCPMIEPLAGNWMSYKDFKDAAPLIRAFYNTVTHPIAEAFSGRLAELEAAGRKIGGYPPTDQYSYDLTNPV